MQIDTKRGYLLMLLVSALVLTGCHQNPITKNTHKKTISVLRHAAIGAEKEIGVPRTTGWTYSACMDVESETRVDCETLFKKMQLLVQKDTAFKNITLAELSNKDTFEPLAEDYDFQVFNAFG